MELLCGVFLVADDKRVSRSILDQGVDTVIGNLHASIAHAVNFKKILTRHFLECVDVGVENDCIGVKCILLH